MTGNNNKHEAELTACAVAAGATMVHPIADMPYQGRSGRFDDPFGDRSSVRALIGSRAAGAPRGWPYTDRHDSALALAHRCDAPHGRARISDVVRASGGCWMTEVALIAPPASAPRSRSPNQVP